MNLDFTDKVAVVTGGAGELAGAAVILAGLACYQWGERWLARRIEPGT